MLGPLIKLPVLIELQLIKHVLSIIIDVNSKPSTAASLAGPPGTPHHRRGLGSTISLVAFESGVVRDFVELPVGVEEDDCHADALPSEADELGGFPGIRRYVEDEETGWHFAPGV